MHPVQSEPGSVAPKAAKGPSFAAVYVEEVHINGFRGLNDARIRFEPKVTVLVGRNNAGKSRVLRALAVALGAEVAKLDDLTVGSSDPATIDVVLAPARPNVPTQDETFSVGEGRKLDPVQILSEEPLRERFGWRTTVSPSAEGLGARIEMSLLTFDASSQSWVLRKNPQRLNRDQRSVVGAHLVETQRDFVDDLARRGSAIQRVLSDLEIPEEEREEIEEELQTLGIRIAEGSQTLDSVTKALADLQDAVGAVGNPSLNALPLRVSELARLVAIDLDTGTGALPIRFHGAGARSLASLQVQSVMYDRRLGKDGSAVRPFPVTLLEEPEAHLHPQAARELATLLDRTRGQVIASTHSAHLVTNVNPLSIRLMRTESGATEVVDFHPVDSPTATTPRARRPHLHASEMEKLKRQVERPFGELLFASAVVIGDGATERAFLPPVLRYALGASAHGVCVVDPGSMNAPLAIAVVKFAELTGIPWVLFCDNDGEGKLAAEQLVEQHAKPGSSHVVFGGPTVEGGGATEAMLVEFDEVLCRAACAAMGTTPGQDTLRSLKGLKGSAGGALAGELLERHTDHGKWPTPLRELIEWMEGALS